MRHQKVVGLGIERGDNSYEFVSEKLSKRIQDEMNRTKRIKKVIKMYIVHTWDKMYKTKRIRQGVKKEYNNMHAFLGKF